jgi:hypothetical protein
MTYEYEGGLYEEEERLRERARHGYDEARQRTLAGLHYAQEASQRAYETVSEAGSEIAARTRDLAGYARRGGARAAHQLGESYEYGRSRFEGSLERHPLAMGLGFFALGVVVGLTIPRTHRERDLFGETSGQILGRARERGRDVMRQGIEAGRRTLRATREEMHAQGLAPGQIRDKARRVYNEGINAARDAAEQEGLTSEELARRADALRERAQESAQQEFERLQRY